MAIFTFRGLKLLTNIFILRLKNKVDNFLRKLCYEKVKIKLPMAKGFFMGLFFFLELGGTSIAGIIRIR